MDWGIFRLSRATFICLVLLATSLIFMTLRLTKTVQMFRSFLFYWITPTQETATNFIQLANDLESRISEIVRAHHENTVLKEKIKQASFLENQYQEVIAENQRLRNLLELKPTLSFELIPARVSGRDAQNWMSAVWIDKGTKDGIKTNYPVLAVCEKEEEDSFITAGVVGRILECGLSSSKVLLLSDPLSSIAASFPRTGEQGLVTGQGSFSIAMEYLDPKADVQVGDQVVTSGLGGIFPPHLSIGRISKVFTTPSGFKDAELITTVSLNKLWEVLVLKTTQ